jgi:hypothetical protein
MISTSERGASKIYRTTKQLCDNTYQRLVLSSSKDGGFFYHIKTINRL